MRVEAYNQVHQLYQTSKVNKTRQTGSTSRTEQPLQFSNLGKDISTAQAAISAAPDIREDLVAPIRTQVQNGTYSVDKESFAEKLLQKASQII